MKSDFLNKTKTAFSNEASIYIYIGRLEKRPMIETGTEQQASFPYETKPDFPDPKFSPVRRSPVTKPTRQSFTGGVGLPIKEVSHELFTGFGTYGKEQPAPKSKPLSEPKQIVYEEDGAIVVKFKQLQVSKPYLIEFNQKKYAVVMPKEGVIDLYELEDS
jgi:hypothetical protein